MSKSKFTMLDSLSLQDFDENSELIPLMTSEDEEAIKNESLPESLPILSLRNTVLFPGVVIPITAGRDKSIQLIKDANSGSKTIGVVSQKDETIEDPSIEDIHTTGTVARILKVLKMPDGNTTVIIQGKKRFKISKIISDTPYMVANIESVPEINPSDSAEFPAILESIKDLALQIIKQSPTIPSEASFAIKNIESNSFLINFVSSNMNLSVIEKQKLLEIHDLKERALLTLKHMNVEFQRLELKNDIQSKVQNDMSQQQREYFLQQQIKTIQEELGGVSYEEEIEAMKSRATSKKWDEAVDKNILGLTKEGKPYTYDFFFGNTGIIDIFKPEGEEWFWNIYKGLADLGVSGVWGDLGEPEVHPYNIIHHTGTGQEVHNTYGHDWARLVYEGYARDFPNQRPFILMRAGYSGSQRYGMLPWSGDVNRTWGGLQSQPEIALQMGMQGMGYMHSDLGGFAGANLDDELYTRWLQYGVFQPIYRPHAQEDVPSEPIFREQRTKALSKKSIELRYSLLPYNYNLAFENSQNGKPLMRPLFFEDENLIEVVKTYIWGDSFLVSPVVSSGIKQQEVVFPKGSNWYNFYSNEKVEGGQTKIVQLTEENIPTFVRGGAFIPTIQPIQNTSTYNLIKFDLHFYFDETVMESEYYLYRDHSKFDFMKQCKYK